MTDSFYISGGGHHEDKRWESTREGREAIGTRWQSRYDPKPIEYSKEHNTFKGIKIAICPAKSLSGSKF